MTSAFLAIYLLLANLLAFAMFGIDKAAARAGRRRIPEKRLFAVSLLGGAPGAWAGMKAWRHKTLHASFRLGIPLLIVVDAIWVYAVLKWL
ncbi:MULTISPECIES: DUF1294 domain-containing protein [unclassified Paenibacillus]|uniref:DUF1294 domain-containing protein n=1 Tax=unclassified Paenibacillus TaxID=185978 RepID=UPI000956E1FA|nr:MULTISPECIES: DUF1294 domain-containing protein [unclassified Paenibacillus]ASS65615.1 DUF1294 domain-containing protein [Paenibacillus sp. RUD330]SIQ29667.1 Uncharacterized membrane protein YsdA, DUF1294 family [Paenibacillus sp. RU4X]SIQ51682.1 Uncharacterized membrane protein YsdA, DUF1294 family [Paenibacillus sp. RU4T]